MEQDFEVVCEKSISVFRYLAEKDFFERYGFMCFLNSSYYKNHLAKRLLYLKNINEDAEKSVLSRLKVRSFQMVNSSF